jgi:hypothetical protein
MQPLKVSIDAGDRLAFNREYEEWTRTLPKIREAILEMRPLPPMTGPTPDGRCIYFGVPWSFHDVLKASGIQFVVIP